MAVSIGNGDFTNYYTSATNASQEAFKSTLDKVNDKSTEAELMEACKEFEAYFIETIYKNMEKTIMSSEDESSSISQYKNFFGDMQIQEYAKQATNQGEGVGLAKELYEQMKRNYGL